MIKSPQILRQNRGSCPRDYATIASITFRCGLFRTEEIISTTHLRFAAGGVALLAGLFIGGSGGAIALADSGTGAGTATTPSTETSSQVANSANRPVATIATTVQKTLQNAVQGVTNALTTPSQNQSKLSSSPKTDVSATQIDLHTNTAASDSSTVTPPSSTATPGPNAGTPDANAASPLTVATTPTPKPTPATTNPTATGTNAATPLNNPATPVVGVPGTNPLPPGNPPSPGANNVFSATNPNLLLPVWQTVVPPVTNAVLTLAYVVGSVPGEVAALPGSPTPVADAITLVQQMLTQVAGAVVPLAQLPSDLYSLMVSAATAQPPVVVVGAAANAGLAATPAPVPAPPALGSSPSLPASGAGSVPIFATVAPFPALGGIATAGIAHELSLSGMTPLAPLAVVSPADTRSILEHAISAIVVPASLSALAALALPGVGGLLILCGAGMRLGYRQAKAAFALRMSGIARFAGPGPLGVVRTGSLVALHLPRPRAVPPAVSRAARVLDEAA